MKTLKRFFLSFVQMIHEYLYSKEEGCGTVLMFHEIYADGEEPIKPNTAISKSNFEAIIEYYGPEHIKKIGCYADILKLKKGDVVLTFDDIYLSAYKNAFPILNKKNIPYVAFVSLGRLNEKNFITDKELNCLKEEQLCTLGSHSIQHVKYRFLPELLYDEAVNSAKILHAQIFAYPYGSYYAVSKKNIKDIEKSGVYSCAFSTVSANITRSSRKNRWMLPRVNVNDSFKLSKG